MADDKAKIDWTKLETPSAEPAPSEPAPPAAAPAAASSEPPAEKIAFFCSNGHRIVVKATMGGQRGKCSKCGVAVRIPRSSAGPSRPAAPDSAGAEEPSSPEPPAADGTPAVDEAVSARADDDAPGGGGGWQTQDRSGSDSVGQSEPREDMFSGLVTTSDSPGSMTEFVELSHQLSAYPQAGQEPASQPPNPTAALVARLFQEMEHGGIVEVHVAGGSVILPEFYEPRWSVGSHGLFASRAADGTVTLTAVAWDSIQKIIVRQVNGLPDGMFE